MKDKLDFLVIGAQKAGTTSLFHYLRLHPEIWLPDGKEMPFFSDDYPTIPFRSWPEYLATVFASAPSDAKWGTVTPQYMTGAILNPSSSDHQLAPVRRIPERIHEIMPDVRLIAILREPVARAISAHRMETEILAEVRTFDDAIEELLTPEALRRAREIPDETSNYVVLGEYARILRGYLGVFPREQVLVAFTEHLECEPEVVMREIFRHLGVDPTFVPPNLGTRYLALGSRRRVPWLKPRAWQGAAARSPLLKAAWHRAPERLRPRILASYWRWSHRIFVWNATDATGDRQHDGCSPHTRTALHAHYAVDGLELRELLGRPLPDQWLTASDD